MSTFWVVVTLTGWRLGLAWRAAPTIESMSAEVRSKFFQPGGDYFVARYTAVRVNRELPPSTFQIPGAKGAKRVKMN